MSINFQEWLSSVNPMEAVKKLEETQIWLKRTVFYGTMGVFATIATSLWLNQMEWRGLNLVFPFALIVIALYHAMEPFKFLFWFGGGTVYYQGLPNNQLSEMLRLKFADFKADELVKAGIKGVNV